MPKKPEFLNNLKKINSLSETDVHTKFLVPLMDALGYEVNKYTQIFPIYIHNGREHQTKLADYIAFDSDEFSKHKTVEEYEWVQDHSLLVVELKKPEESVEAAKGQAASYAFWSGVAFYVITNGKELAIYQRKFYAKVDEIFKCSVSEIGAKWFEIKKLISPKNIIEFCRKNEIKFTHTSGISYENYKAAMYAYWQEITTNSIERTLSNPTDAPTPKFSIKVSSIVNDKAIVSAPFETLLKNVKPVVVLAELGGGKSFLLRMLAVKLLETADDTELKNRVPIIIEAKQWKRSFNNLQEAVQKQLEFFVKGLDSDVTLDELKAGRFFLLIDGLDEVTAELATLIDELQQLAGSVPIIVSWRKDTYKEQLRYHFNSFEIDVLKESEIIRYAKDELGSVGYLLLEHLTPALRELVVNPLFLLMVVSIIKNSPHHQLPDNKAELYREFVNYLISDWEAAKNRTEPMLIDTYLKEKVLAEYAQKIFLTGSSDDAFAKAIDAHKGTDSVAIIRSELKRSGLLKETPDGFDFIHPSFQEYFLAYYLAKLADIDAYTNFVTSNCANDIYGQIFIFLSGMLRDREREDILLDALEANNLRLYYLCLEAKYDRGEQLEKQWSRKDTTNYLTVLRKSYLNLIENHFQKLKGQFYPWRDLGQNNLVVKEKNNLVVITGGLDPTEQSLKFKFSFADSGPASLIVLTDVVGIPVANLPIGVNKVSSISTPISWSFGFDGTMRYNLRLCRWGLDSARKVALEVVKHSVKELFKNYEQTFWYVIPPLACEHVESMLNRARFSSRHGFIPAEFRDLTIYRPIGEVINIVKPFISKIRGLEDLFQGLNVLQTLPYDYHKYLLPINDVPFSEIPNDKTKYSWYNWKDETLIQRVVGFYNYFQQCYRIFVEQFLPSLKDSLYFYRIGPVRFEVIINKIDLPEEEDCFLSVNWLPVSESEDWNTKVELCHRTSRDWEEENEVVVRELREKTLKALDRIIDPPKTFNPYLSSLQIEDVIFNDQPLHKAIFEQLEKDLTHIFGSW